MTDIKEWDATDADNNGASPGGWPDGQAPATVKGVGRAMMGAVRRQFNDGPWFDWGDSSAVNNLTFLSTTSFKMDGDVTGRYLVNRRLRIADTSTLYGSVISTSMSAAGTTVTVNLDSGVLSTSITAIALSNITPLGLPPTVEVGNNILINGDFVVAQRGTAFTAATTPKNDDDTYLLDRWVLLSDGNDVMDVSQVTAEASLPSGARSVVKLLVATADKKAGMVQIVENKDSKIAVGGIVSFSFKAKSGTVTNLDKLRAGILGWSGAADTVTSDVVNSTSWEAEGVDPVLATNWSYQNTPGDLTISAGAYKTFEIEAVNVAASLNNLAVFVWVDNTDATLGEEVYITDCQLNVGGSAGKFDVRPFGEELNLCQRYYEQSYNLGIAPGTVTENGKRFADNELIVNGGNYTVRRRDINTVLKENKRAVPTMTYYSPSSATAANVRVIVRSGSTTISDNTDAFTNYTASGTDTYSAYYIANTNAEITTGTYDAGYRVSTEYHYTAESEL